MSCQKIITIVNNVRIVGEDGTIKWFIPWNQFCFEDTQEVVNRCNSCSEDYETRVYLHYRVVIDDEDFLIPDWAVAHDDRVREDWEVNARALQEHENRQPKDWKKAYKEATGIDIEKFEGRQDNGAFLTRKLKQRYENIKKDS